MHHNKYPLLLATLTSRGCFLSVSTFLFCQLSNAFFSKRNHSKYMEKSLKEFTLGILHQNKKQQLFLLKTVNSHHLFGIPAISCSNFLSPKLNIFKCCQLLQLSWFLFSSVTILLVSFLLLWTNTWHKQLKRRKVYFGSQFLKWVGSVALLPEGRQKHHGRRAWPRNSAHLMKRKRELPSLGKRTSQGPYLVPEVTTTWSTPFS